MEWMKGIEGPGGWDMVEEIEGRTNHLPISIDAKTWKVAQLGPDWRPMQLVAQRGAKEKEESTPDHDDNQQLRQSDFALTDEGYLINGERRLASWSEMMPWSQEIPANQRQELAACISRANEILGNGKTVQEDLEGNLMEWMEDDGIYLS